MTLNQNNPKDLRRILIKIILPVMAIDQIEPVVERFITQDLDEVLVLKGRWGVGKTHFWHSLISSQNQAIEQGIWGRVTGRARNNTNIAKEKYSYVSMFGANSIDEVKRSIFTSIVDSENAHRDSYIGKFRSITDLVDDIPKIEEWGGSAVLEKALFDRVQDTLICIDDLERRGNDLRMRDLLGLASMLKEGRRCQVVLILNDNALEEDGLEEFEQYGEKLIDLEVRFERTPEGAFQCVYDETDDFAEIIRGSVCQLGVKNVRIIQRLKRLIDKLRPYLEKCEPGTERTTLETLTLLVWCYYGEEGRSPSLTDLKEHHSLYSQVTDAEEGEWTHLLQQYGYVKFGELDSVLLSLIERGYLSPAEIKHQIKRKDEQNRVQDATKRLREAWNLYYDSFDDNEDKFCQELIHAVEETIDYISVHDLNSAVEVLRSLQREEDADELIDAYVHRHKDNPSKLDLSEMMRGEDVSDPRLRDALNQALEKTEEGATFSEVLERASDGERFGGADKSFLAQASSDKYYQFFKSRSGKTLRRSVKWCLKHGRITNPDPENEAIYRKTMEALSEIADNTRFNEYRLSNIYDVDVDELTN